jgi:competence protein ComEC
VVPALRALGVERLDLVAASHGDLDHRGGLPAVVSALPVGRIWLPRGASADPAFAELRARAAAAGVPVEEHGSGDAVQSFGDLRIAALWPPESRSSGSSGAAASRNSRSLVLRVETSHAQVLLPGDLDAAAEQALVASGAALASEVLLTPHHGSRTSSSARFLAAVDADLAIVSAPCAGRFDLPHGEVRARLRAAGLALWWTGRDGAVLVELGATPWARGWRRDVAPACER